MLYYVTGMGDTMEILDKYITNQGEIYNIRDVHLYNISEIMNIGELVKVTGVKSKFFDGSNLGVSIFKSHYNPNYGLKIYNDFADYRYFPHFDHLFVQELQNKQKNIKLTEFPTGVITIENKVVGQEIKFYNDHVELTDCISKVDIIDIYLKILEILKELCSDDIYYCDVNTRNFMIDLENMVVKLIDFDKQYVTIKDTPNRYYYKGMLDNLKRMIKNINDEYKIKFDESFYKIESLDQIQEYVYEKQYKK